MHTRKVVASVAHNVSLGHSQFSKIGSALNSFCKMTIGLALPIDPGPTYKCSDPGPTYECSDPGPTYEYVIQSTLQATFSNVFVQSRRHPVIQVSQINVTRPSYSDGIHTAPDFCEQLREKTSTPCIAPSVPDVNASCPAYE